MTKQPFRTLVIGNAVAALLACFWAYSAYIYNWLNIGGGTSVYMEEWITLGGILPYVALIAWLAVLAFSVAHRYCRTQSLSWRIFAGLLSFAIAPTAFFVADWFFHHDFPLPPPL